MSLIVILTWNLASLTIGNNSNMSFSIVSYNTGRIVSMIELTSTHQWAEEPVIDYIHRWRNLSLNFKDRLSKVSALDVCIQGMNWELPYILQGVKLKSFEELATRSHNMELSIAAAGSQALPIQEPKKAKEKYEFHKGGKAPTKIEVIQSMSVSTAQFKFFANVSIG